MKVLVTGFGLLGRATAKLYQEAGHEVVVLRSRPRDADPEDGSFTFAYANLADFPRLLSLIRDEKIELVVHTAAVSGPMVQTDNPFWTISVNVMGTANVLEAARMAGVRRVVNSSSIAAYGTPLGSNWDENEAFRPSTVYGATKAAVDVLAAAYRRQHGLFTVSLRISYVYGPRRTTGCFLRRMLKEAMSAQPVTYPSGAEQRYNLIYVDDAAKGLFLAGTAPEKNLGAVSYNVGATTATSIQELNETMKSLFPNSKVSVGPGVWEGEDQVIGYDLTAAKRDFNFEPVYSLAEGLEVYAAWLKRHQY